MFDIRGRAHVQVWSRVADEEVVNIWFCTELWHPINDVTKTCPLYSNKRQINH